MRQLPYFDMLLSELAGNNAAIEKSFGRHVHWGCWDDPARATGSDDDYAQAAEALTRRLCDLARIADGQAVLDVGCGFGGTVASLNERFDRLQLTGLNIDARQLARARALVHPRPGNTIAFVEGDACALPFPDASFDRVLAVECIFHFPSRAAFFREARRVLKPGGILALSDFVPAPAFLPAAWLLKRPMLARWNLFGPCDLGSTLQAYRKLAVAADFESADEIDITRNTLPTYAYLKQLLASAGAPGILRQLSGPVIGLQEWLARSALLQYRLLAFRAR